MEQELTVVVIQRRHLRRVKPPLVGCLEELVIRQPEVFELVPEIEQHDWPPVWFRKPSSRFRFGAHLLCASVHTETGNLYRK